MSKFTFNYRMVKHLFNGNEIYTVSAVYYNKDGGISKVEDFLGTAFDGIEDVKKFLIENDFDESVFIVSDIENNEPLDFVEISRIIGG